jgi:Tfp pilus assembly protein PilE
MSYIKKIYQVDAGFSVIQLLVVIAILGSLAAVAGVSFGKYIDRGKAEAYATELDDIQTAVSTMLHESSAGKLDSVQTDIDDMDMVTADSGALLLTNYLKRLGGDGKVQTNCHYSFTIDGKVTQVSTP